MAGQDCRYTGYRFIGSLVMFILNKGPAEKAKAAQLAHSISDERGGGGKAKLIILGISLTRTLTLSFALPNWYI